jgi:hypothetical protein
MLKRRLPRKRPTPRLKPKLRLKLKQKKKSTKKNYCNKPYCWRRLKLRLRDLQSKNLWLTLMMMPAKSLTKP